MSAVTPKSLGTKLFDVLASYGLCCILILLLFLLTFLGTLEQTSSGLFDVQKKYFESYFLVHWLFDTVPVPLPGAYLVQVVLAVNLTLGGFIRIRKARATVGVIIIHAGIAVLLVAGFVKLQFSNDGQLTLYEKGRAQPSMTQGDEYSSYHEWEIAIFDASATRDIEELIIPDTEFLFDLGPDTKRTRTFKNAKLPFDIELSNALRNCRALPKGPRWQATLPVVDGHALFAQDLAKENEANVAGVYVTVRGADLQQQGILWGHERYPWVVNSGGKRWALSLRKKRFKMPFTIVLDKFTRELYPRTQIPKVFKSEVTKIEGTDATPYKIEMNEPLRHGGLTLFQASWGPADAGPGQPLFSTFAVVRNPSDHWPLYSCIIISIGLLIAFTDKLVKYTRSQAKRRAEQEAAHA